MSSISILEIPLYVTLSKLIIDPKHNVESKDNLCAESIPSTSLVGLISA